MKNILAIILIIVAGNAYAYTKVDPLIRLMNVQEVSSLKGSKAFGIKTIANVTYADVMIKTADIDGTRELINSFGGQVRSVIRDILTASIPLDMIQQLEESEDVIYIEAAKPMHSKMDYARSVTGVASVQDGTGTTGNVSYTGAGVIVGVVDSGIDCEHADFKDGSGTTRIVAYWDQSVTGGGGVTEITNSDGIEYTGSELTDGTCASSADSSDEGHGTHVTGIAAGNDSTYKGVAYGANIISVRLSEPSYKTSGYSSYLSTLSTNITEGVDYIFRKAHTLGKPAVVNLSIGTSLGAHDGSSLLEEALDGLLIESGTTEKEGRAIVNAAGNENTSLLASSYTAGGIHAEIDVSANQSEAFEFFPNSGGSIDPVGGVGGTWVDIWLDSGSSCTIALKAFSRNSKTTALASTTPVSAGETNDDTPTTYSTLSMYVNFEDDANTLNGKQHALALVTDTNSSTLDNYSFDLIFNGACAGDAWLYFDNVYYNYFTNRYGGSTNAAYGYTYVDGDNGKAMTVPATANKPIAVGSFMARGTWTDINGNEQSQTGVFNGTVGDISKFSNLGPSADARTKPEITAPGEPIISTLASTVSGANAEEADETHHMLYGTSMASPHVAGAVALMLEKNGCLKSAQIKASITETADGVANQTLPNNTWGYGKLDAAAAVNSVTASSCAPNNASEEGASDGGDSSDGSDGGSSDDDSGTTASTSCSLGKNLSASLMSVFVALFTNFCVILALNATKTRKKIRSRQNH